MSRDRTRPEARDDTETYGLAVPVVATVVATVMAHVLAYFTWRKAQQPTIEPGAKSELAGQQVAVWTPGFTETAALIAIVNIVLLVWVLWPNDQYEDES